MWGLVCEVWFPMSAAHAQLLRVCPMQGWGLHRVFRGSGGIRRSYSRAEWLRPETEQALVLSLVGAWITCLRLIHGTSALAGTSVPQAFAFSSFEQIGLRVDLHDACRSRSFSAKIYNMVCI